MNIKILIKKLILLLLNLLYILWTIIPFKVRLFIITSIIMVESRGVSSKDSLSRLFSIKDNLEWIINERAMFYGDGIHPKHRLTNYHNFFVKKIRNGQKVIDLGCGYGEVSKSIAKFHPKSEVVGIDYDAIVLDIAMKNNSLENLKFIKADITNLKKSKILKADVVILSNVLEHVTKRVSLLMNLITITSSKVFLIRVPLFERNWQIALRKELGINFFSDNDHKIEHTFDEFNNEIKLSGLYVYELISNWGEIWADCRLIKKEL